VKCLEKHIVPENIEPERFRNYAQAHFNALYPSNKSIKKAIDKGLFTLNGQPAGTGDWLKAGDVVEIWQESRKEVLIPRLNFRSCYEDEHCLVIHKAPGIPVHSRGKFNVSYQLQTWRMSGNRQDELACPQPVHRLDAATEGLLIAAKTRSFQIAIGHLFTNREIEKRYSAILLGKIEGRGTFSDPIDDKSALSAYESIAQKEFPGWGWLSLVRLYPKTGRTHQLRIHCAKNGHPILGERKYAPEVKNLKGKGLFLFADQLNFTHPLSGKRLHLSLELAKKFKKYF
jgi:23S rRNA pseudouridine1911/1915/1917 synthase